MQNSSKGGSVDATILLISIFLILISVGILRSIIPSIFPLYFIYIFVGFLLYFTFSKLDFDILTVFYKNIYVVCLILLTLPLILGEITRGAVRWIPLGPVAIQPSELVRPFLILFFAKYLTSGQLTFARLFRAGLFLLLPVMLIVIQPSLGVSILTMISFVGVLMASTINKKLIFGALVIPILFLPLLWLIMAPYQKERVVSFLNPSVDPLGAGYNSIQSMISVGSGRLTGRGLGKGVQTQLSFLPERHNDFVFASISEELGFIGVSLVLVCFFVLLWRLTVIIENAKSPTARAYVSGFFLVVFAQIIFNIGMNIGLFPITGIPLPLVSAGGSSFLSTMISLGIVSNSLRR